MLAQGAFWLGGFWADFCCRPQWASRPARKRSGCDWASSLLRSCLAWCSSRRGVGADRVDSLWWAATALLVLAIAVAVFFRYQQFTSPGPAITTGRSRSGSALTPHGLAYTQANPDLSRDQLVMDFAGATETVWTRESINRRRLILAATYVSCLPLFTLCLIAVVQALQCGGPPTRPRASR